MPQEEPDVFTPPNWYLEAEELRILPRALMGGTPDMKAGGKLWLPKERGEKDWYPDNEYRERLERSTLLRAYAQAVEGVVGKVFAQPLTLGPDVPPEIAGRAEGDGEAVDGWAENVDLMGNNLQTFASDALAIGVAEGGGAVLTDFQDTGAAVVSAADEATFGLRPYLVHYPPADVLDAVPRLMGGRPVLWRARLLERLEVTGPDYRPICTNRCRVLFRGDPAASDDTEERWARWELWEQDEKKRAQRVNGAAGEGVFLDSTGNPFEEIPLDLIPAGKRVGFWRYRPLMLDLAYLNLKHWRLDSDTMSQLHIALISIMVAKMDPPVKDTTGAGSPAVRGGVNLETIGARRISYVGKDGDLSYVTTNPAITREARELLADVKRDMQWASLEPELANQTGGITATEAAIRTAQAHKVIGELAARYQNTIEQWLLRMAQYAFGVRSARTGGSVKLNTKFPTVKVDQPRIQALREARIGDGTTPSISLETYWAGLQECGVMPEDWTPDIERERLVNEAELMVAIEAKKRAAAPTPTPEMAPPGPKDDAAFPDGGPQAMPPPQATNGAPAGEEQA